MLGRRTPLARQISSLSAYPFYVQFQGQGLGVRPNPLKRWQEQLALQQGN